MEKNILRFTTVVILMILFSCNKKTVPATNAKASTSSSTSSSTETTSAIGTTTAPKTKAAVPKVIAVNDAAAHKTIDGRYFYDLNGKRYWRNNKDGKYYLFNKSMYSNPDFDPPKN